MEIHTKPQGLGFLPMGHPTGSYLRAQKAATTKRVQRMKTTEMPRLKLLKLLVTNQMGRNK